MELGKELPGVQKAALLSGDLHTYDFSKVQQKKVSRKLP